MKLGSRRSTGGLREPSAVNHYLGGFAGLRSVQQLDALLWHRTEVFGAAAISSESGGSTDQDLNALDVHGTVAPASEPPKRATLTAIDGGKELRKALKNSVGRISFPLSCKALISKGSRSSLWGAKNNLI